MRVDLLFDPFAARWTDVRSGALAAEAAGFDGVWLYDHLAGSVHGAPHVLECWTTLSAIAALVPRIVIGPMVLNVANRDPGVLAVMAATLQHVSQGRLLLGLGAGGGTDTPYAAEQQALGRRVLADPARRRAVEEAIAVLRAAWSGEVAGVGGFLRPEPPPPIVIGAFGSKWPNWPAAWPMGSTFRRDRACPASSNRLARRVLALVAAPTGSWSRRRVSQWLVNGKGWPRRASTA